MRGLLAGAGFVACGLLAGCLLLTDLDGFTSGSSAACDGGACADAIAPPGDGGGPITDGGGSDGPKDEGGCPTGKGSAMVPVMGFCIDATEATVGHYRAFLTAMADLADRGLETQVAECKWNATFVPEYWYPAFPKESALSAAQIDSMPISVVDWCDARRFCEWAGKRLCGKVGGGAVSPADGPTPKSEWNLACSHNGLNAYAYGGAYVAGNCNDDKLGETQGRKPVGSFPKCQGGYPGLFDMSGNITEWIDSCEAPAGEDAGDTSCATVGGPWNYPPPSVACDAYQADPRNNAGPQGGIRCCATP